ncbi:plant UBX domain-containing protein 8 [Malania oleifera]|uniref:plant UBX domain-containing protein 8 n=1 Tax=Malania oleifera TaxID=397392 RepID=UPI0025AE23B7|nr:plant UBX domain-containing protein 8 [Malania oleifera]
MARPTQEAIDTFMSITGASEAVAVQKLEEHGEDLNEAVNAHFSEGDRNIMHETSIAAQNDFMDVDDPSQLESGGAPFPLLSAARNLNPFSILDPNLSRSLLGHSSELSSAAPIVSHPREVREIPIEVKDGTEPSRHSGRIPTIEDVTGTADIHGPEIHGTVIIDDENDENIPTTPTGHSAGWNERKNGGLGNSSHDGHGRPSAPEFDKFSDFGNDIEEEMIRAAIEASRQEVEEEGFPAQKIGTHTDSNAPGPHQRRSPLEDAELAQAVSLSLKTAEQEKALREQGIKVEASKVGAYEPSEVEDLGKSAALNGRVEAGSSFIQDETEDVEEPLVRHRSRHMSSGSMEPTEDVGEVGEIGVSPPSSPGQNGSHSQHNGNSFPSDEWGGISSLEHDEAVMLEAAMFGGIPEGSSYRFPYAPHQLMQTGLSSTVGPYTQRMPRPPSPSLEAQRLIREQQDDEYLASLQADQEKELKAMEEAKARRLMELAAREAALEEERRKEEESRKKLEEEEEFERELVAKEASLPEEPALDDENSVTLLVRMPNGSRRGRRFLKSDKLQSLFDFIDVGKGVKPGTYRLVRPYPRRAFSDAECASSLNELGLTSKQEALFLELI